MTKYMELMDESSYVGMTVAYLQSRRELMKARPRKQAEFQDEIIDETSRESATASLFNVRCRRRMYHAMRLLPDGAEAALNAPLKTILLGFPCDQNAAMAGVFAGEAPDTDLRVIIHSSPRYYCGIAVEPVWACGYRGKVSIVRARMQLSREQQEEAEAFLREYARSIRRDNDADDLVTGSRHSYWINRSR